MFCSFCQNLRTVSRQVFGKRPRAYAARAYRAAKRLPSTARAGVSKAIRSANSSGVSSAWRRRPCSEAQASNASKLYRTNSSGDFWLAIPVAKGFLNEAKGRGTGRNSSSHAASSAGAEGVIHPKRLCHKFWKALSNTCAQPVKLAKNRNMARNANKATTKAARAKTIHFKNLAIGAKADNKDDEVSGLAGDEPEFPLWTG